MIKDVMNKKLSKPQQAGQTRELLHPVRPTKKQRIINYLIGAALGFIALALGLFLYWTFTGKDVLVVNNEPVPVKPAFVKTEEKITIVLDVCKLEEVQGTVYTRFVSDKTELVVPTTKENWGADCYENAEIEVPIPPQLTQDVWHLNYRIDYETNPLTTVREEFNTQDFTVTE